MAASVPSASPCLVAILLVTQPRSGSGARLVFHYPPEPLSAEADEAGGRELSLSNEHTSSSSSNNDSSTEEEVHNPRSRDGRKTRQRNGHGAALTDDEDEREHSRGDQHYDHHHWKPSWEPLLGLGSSGLAGLLAAGRVWHRKKFELGINDLCFVGRPVFVREHGHWRRQKSRKAARSDSSLPDQLAEAAALTKDSDAEGETTADSTDAQDIQPISTKNQLTMFHVVFVLDPPPLEHDLRVREMYRHIVKKFTRALKREQARRDFVWKESEIMQSIKSRHMAQHSSAKPMYHELLSKSQLAASIASVYRAVSTSRIASVNLSASNSVVLQIPPVISISVLPSLTDPPVPAGLWLTTFNDATPLSGETEGLAISSADQLAKHATLLLKESPQRIIKEAQAAGGLLATPLTKFVNAIKPTKSFHKLAQAFQMSSGDIRLLTSHLIVLRRAMVIPPLHQRDTYIVSPNADMSRLMSACKVYNTAFPTLPGLATILAALSGTPLPWMTQMRIPSRDHKAAYYEILAWLMKGGWVTQLRTFAYVRVSVEVKKAVLDQEKKDKLEKKNTEAANTPEEGEENGTTTSVVDTGSLNHTNTGGDDSERSFASDASSQGPRRPSLMSRASSDQRQQILSSKAVHDPISASLILNPSRASPLESKWLDHIADSLLTTQYSPVKLSVEERIELKTCWLRFLKYFNGSEPLEFIPVREGMKRTLVWDLLGRMGMDLDGGVEIDGGTVGDRPNGNSRILVTVRHW